MLFFIFVHFHSYTSNRIKPQYNNQINSSQVCVMGFFLLKVGPPLEKFSGSAPEHILSIRTEWISKLHNVFIPTGSIEFCIMINVKCLHGWQCTNNWRFSCRFRGPLLRHWLWEIFCCGLPLCYIMTYTGCKY